MATQYRYLRHNTTDGVLVLSLTERQLQGDALAETLRKEILEIFAQSGAQKIVLDFKPVQYIASAAFRPLLSLRRKLLETNGRLVLCNLSKPVTEVFAQLRLISTNPLYHATFDTQPDVPSAITFLNTPDTKK